MVSPTTVLVHEAWLQSSENTSHRDRWLCDETILRRIRLRLPTINLNRRAINLALKSIAGSHHSTNILGLYHDEFRTIYPYNTNKKPRDVQYFYRYVCTKPSFPRFPSDVGDIITREVRLVEEREISSGDSETNTNNDEEEKLITEKEKEAQLEYFLNDGARASERDEPVVCSS